MINLKSAIVEDFHKNIGSTIDDDWVVLRDEIDFGKPSSEGPAACPAPRPQEELAPRRQPQRPLDTSSNRWETFPLRIQPA
ncbi:uncharacterized protein HD556DRAFT_1441004 [Suillus plorans]|uniref:Uncharacterized protein n=1 Tax=Suillus plorans TaxID=116603 RepID=A0A9P7DL17_9AGAM|nr:uncharacterized protein HD556DRAFT_1441004 [Suillus plorans]KAG1797446.1 hypothetical protein HD556DRAFT_1441004 [Suillus plorans]